MAEATFPMTAASLPSVLLFAFYSFVPEEQIVWSLNHFRCYCCICQTNNSGVFFLLFPQSYYVIISLWFKRDHLNYCYIDAGVMTTIFPQRVLAAS